MQKVAGEFNILPLGTDFYNRSQPIGDLPGMVDGTESMTNKYTVFSLARVSRGANSSTGFYKSDLHVDVKKLVNPDKSLTPLSILDNHKDDNNYKPAASQNLTAGAIINYSKKSEGKSLMGNMPYSWSDFLYCSHYMKVPNTNMVTLRRYPVPVYDNAQSPDDDVLVPVAQAVTYFGEKTGNKLSDLMKFSYGLIWTEIESKVQDVDGNERGLGAGIETLLGGKDVGKLGVAQTMMGQNSMGRWDGSAQKEQEYLKNAWGDNGPYWNQVYGPVNVIHKTYKRDRGMKFEGNINIRFSYSLRSHQGVNPKVAMLDIISNFLNLTYNNAKFWGGATRYFPNFQDQVGFLGSQTAFYNGKWGDYFTSVKDELTDLGNKLMSTMKNVISNPVDAISELANTAFGMAMGKLAKESRPHILSIRNLLSGAPVGEWHITIGNPIDPIAVMGNMLVDNVQFSTSDALGADDFPNEVYFDVSLKHGRPRDLGDIESMLNMGMGKISYSPLVNLPSEQNTHGDASNKQRGKEYNKRNEFAESTRMYNTSQLREKYLTTSESKIAYNTARTRLKSDWGEKFGNSKHLVYLMSKTSCKF